MGPKNLPTTKIIYYSQHVNARGQVESKVRIEVPGLGITITDAFEQWKAFMSACGYGGMDKLELTEVEDDDT